jgi:D-alanine-D-alanine ligase
LNVALTFNVRPEEEVTAEILPSNEIVSPISNTSLKTKQKYNDAFAEWDTIETIEAVANALSLYNDVTMIEADENAYEKFKLYRPDIVFNIAEGMNGLSREAQIPAMLDMLNIPYTGSDPLTLATCLDKSRAKEILTYHKIRTAKFLTEPGKSDLKNFTLKFPVIVKPVGEGSSKGIFNNSFITNIRDLETTVEENFEVYKQPSLIEEFLPGREFTVALIGNDDEAIILPVVEINFNTLPENLVPTGGIIL